MQERRRYVRLNIPLEVSYAVQGEKGPRYKSITKNISPGGVRFMLEKELVCGSVLDLEIKIPTKAEPIPIKARVVWIKKEQQQGKDTYDAGFEFTKISEENKTEFFQYFCNLMYDQFKKIE